MRRTKNRLADGREIIYFDFDSAPKRNHKDLRNFPKKESFSGQMRYDILTDEWVSVADHRQTRIFHPDAAQCPLCPSTAVHKSEIPDSNYSVVVFENQFPSFGSTEKLNIKPNPDWGDEIPATGRCEVIAYSPQHDGSLGKLTDIEMELVISAWIDRSVELAQNDQIKSVFIFENRGPEVGVTLHHPHGQIYGYPFLPAYQQKLLEQGKRYRELHARSMLDDVIARELLADDRIVFQDANWIAFVPHAARWPYEIQLHPMRNIAYMSELNAREEKSLASFLPKLIRALDRMFDFPLPYMAGWIQGPVNTTQPREDFRLFMRLVSVQRGKSKLKYLAGSESLMGAWISDITPESAAQQIRSVLELELSE